MKMSEIIIFVKRMCRIDRQSKKLIRLKYLILETPYTFYSTDRPLPFFKLGEVNFNYLPWRGRGSEKLKKGDEAW